MNVTSDINKSIFRGYDIRGINDIDLTSDVAYTIGKSYGTILINDYKSKKVIVGHDNRVSSEMLSNAFIKGVNDTGVDVIDIGLVTSSMLYYACEVFSIYAGVMITASHNPKEYNGFKLSFDKKGEICGDEIVSFRDFTLNGNFLIGKGQVEHKNINQDYAKMMVSNFNFKNKIKVVVDPGNGTSSIIVHDIFSKLNLDVSYICDTSDSNFPNHHPDPAEAKNLVMLQNEVIKTGADIGIALDGDSDRVGIVDNEGKIISSDYYMAIMAKHILPKLDRKGIIFDVSCSKTLSDEVRRAGGNPVVYKTGNSYIKREMLRQGMLFGGEISGHTFFKDKFYGFDDGIYAGLRMVELLDEENKKLSALEKDLIKYYSTPVIKIKVDDLKKSLIVEKVKEYCINKGYNTATIDGARPEFEDGFAIIRMSNTTPSLTLRFEATTKERLDKIQNEFETLVNKLIEEI